MIYHHLFDRAEKKEVTAAIIGSGHFAAAISAQQSYTPRLRIPVIVDRDLDRARKTLELSEIPPERIATAGTVAEADEKIRDGCYLYTDRADLAWSIPSIDVVCEATGSPEAGAVHCLAALENGKHVAIINKELDSAVGPILRRKAEEQGLICTPVDGDQHGLLISMVEWARSIGLTVLSAGKARDGEFVLDDTTRTVSIAADGITVHHDASTTLSQEEWQYLSMIPEGRSAEYLTKREQLLCKLPGAGGFDLCEMTIVCNATGLPPASDTLTQGTLRITELPVAYCGRDQGGIYGQEGCVDVITCLRRSDESGMGGGVYLVVRCDNAYANYILTTKGQIPNYDRTAAVIYRPYHLCGVEVSTSLLCAGLLGLSTGAREYLPRYDLVRVAARNIAAGEQLGNDHDIKMTSRILPATSRGDDRPVPAHLLNGNTASKDIGAGELITYSMVKAPAESVLWDLRREQESVFSM